MITDPIPQQDAPDARGFCEIHHAFADGPRVGTSELDKTPAVGLTSDVFWSEIPGNIGQIFRRHGKLLRVYSYIAVLVMKCFTIYFYYVESKGLPLEEIARVFDGDDAAAAVVADSLVVNEEGNPNIAVSRRGSKVWRPGDWYHETYVRMRRYGVTGKVRAPTDDPV